MNHSQIRDVSEAILFPLTEAELAKQYSEEGIRTVSHCGRYWKEIYPGFYQPIHLLARLSEEQAMKPTLLSWGFQAALERDDVAAKNASIPVQLLSNLENYDLQSFPSKRRFHIKKCYKTVRLVEISSSSLLQEQGYEVVLSSLERTKNPVETVPTRAEYLKKCEKMNEHKNQFVIAGLIGDKLGGYMTGYAVDRTAYTGDIYIATEALSTSIGSGLIFEFVQACRRSKQINEVCYGLHLPEEESLSAFKEGMGFPLQYIPAKIQMNQIVGKLIRWRYPYKYYRLTGDLSICTDILT